MSTYNNRRNNPRYSGGQADEDARRRLQERAQNMCLHRYFTNVPGQPQRMRMCTLESGHQGPCGQEKGRAA